MGGGGVLKLRDYQEEAVAAVIQAARRGTRRQLVVLPTGAGKTVFAAALSRRASGRVLFLCHTTELVQQAVEKFGYLWPANELGVVQATRDEHDRRVVVASIQTLQHTRRLDRLRPDSFSLVIVDESQHAPSASWQQVLTRLGFLPEPQAGRLLVGITATPMRGDGVGLGRVFDAITYRRSIQDLVRAGYLADVRGVRVVTQVDLTGVRRSAGDFQLRELSQAVDTPRRNQLVVEAYQEHGEGRKAMAFTVDILHARHLAAAFQQAGYRADWVSGELPVAERADRLRRFREGELDLMANAQLLIEGYDDPSVACLLMTRPTRSKALFIQMVGRGLRVYPGKTDCLVLDVTDSGHDLISLATLAGDGELVVREERRTAPGPERQPADTEVPDVPISVAGTVPLDLLARSQFVWRTSRTRMVLEAGPGQEIVCVQDNGDRWTVTLVGKGVREALSDQPLPLAYAQGVAEDWVRAQNLEGYAARDAAWRSRPVTDRQRELLAQLGAGVRSDLTRAEAKDLIRETLQRRALEDPHAPWRQDPASEKQIAWMERHGYTIPAGFTKGDFHDLMDRLKHGRRGAL